METREDEFQGFRRLTITNSHIAISLLPQLGGKLISLKRAASDTEWLHLNPHLPLRLPVYGSSYVREYDSGGWDECFPSISEELHPDNGTAIPDHGELWGLPWDVTLEKSEGVVRASGRVQSTKFPIEFRRDITIAEGADEAVFAYTLTNLGSTPLQYLWSAHPLLNISPGMTLTIESGAEVRVNGDSDAVAGSWPVLAPDTRVDIVPPVDARIARKLFVGPLTNGSVTVTSQGGESLSFRFSPVEVPYVGLWQNFGGWCGNESFPAYYNMGVEPCTSAPDSLRVSSSWHSARCLPASSSVSWSLGVHLHAQS